MAKVIPFAPIERLIRTAGAHRVSESAGVTLTEILEEYGLEISREAIKLAEHAGRKTVKAEDIKLAKEMILNLTQHVGFNPCFSGSCIRMVSAGYRLAGGLLFQSLF